MQLLEGGRVVINYEDWLFTDDPRYVCIEGYCPKLFLPQGIIHSMQCRDANVKEDTL